MGPVVNENSENRELEELKCTHQEADTRIVWHLEFISEQNFAGNVIVRCGDTDILITLLYHIHRLDLNI